MRGIGDGGGEELYLAIEVVIKGEMEKRVREVSDMEDVDKGAGTVPFELMRRFRLPGGLISMYGRQKKERRAIR